MRAVGVGAIEITDGSGGKAALLCPSQGITKCCKRVAAGTQKVYALRVIFLTMKKPPGCRATAPPDAVNAS